jgi:hypothetical protein
MAGHPWSAAQRRAFNARMKANKASGKSDWTEERRRKFAATLAARKAAVINDKWTPAQRAAYDKTISDRKSRETAELAAIKAAEPNGKRGRRKGYKQTPEHVSRILAAKKEKAAARAMQGLVAQHNGHGAPAGNVLTTEVKVGSEIAFSFGTVRVIVRAVA